ncbi:MAG: hypothetical protein K2N00_03930 [Lachnospiraceae bacterium]|nr:hypothetical protein [Lachnospiraceae bacterium]
MTKNWSVTDSMGNVHQIAFTKGFGGAKCIVDGDTYKMKSKNLVIWMADHQISIPGAECNLVVIGNKVRLAVNGTYLEDGTPYEPIRNIPVGINVLVGLSAVVSIFMFGLIGFCINILVDLAAYKMTLSKKTGAAYGILIAFTVVVLVLGFLVIGVQLAEM